MPGLSLTTILIHGVPRSGTSWLGQIFNAHQDVAYRYQPLFSHAFKDRLAPDSSPEAVAEFFDDLMITDDPFVLGRDPDIHASNPEFSKSADSTHLVVKHVRYHHLLSKWLRSQDNLKVVALVRHPCAVMLSWFNAPREFNPEWDPHKEWRSAQSKNQDRPEEFNGFERWKEAARLFLRLSQERPQQCRLLRYCDLLTDPLGETESVFRWAGLQPTTQSIAFVRESTSRHVENAYAVHKIKNDDRRWQKDLHPAIADAILSDIKDTELEHFTR